MFPPDMLRRFETPGALAGQFFGGEEQKSVVKIDNLKPFTVTSSGPLLAIEEVKFIWLKSLIVDETTEVLRPYLMLFNPDCFITCDQIYQFLEDVHSNPDEAVIAHDDLEHLRQNSATFFDSSNLVYNS
ncbi:hypothetical protein F4861DRAFT_544423 [Xylaria intraflava]|nr:hypothetical protein F4861DRAFT_544423 [Xylaria intraflava]